MLLEITVLDLKIIKFVSLVNFGGSRRENSAKYEVHHGDISYKLWVISDNFYPNQNTFIIIIIKMVLFYSFIQ